MKISNGTLLKRQGQFQPLQSPESILNANGKEGKKSCLSLLTRCVKNKPEDKELTGDTWFEAALGEDDDDVREEPEATYSSEQSKRHQRDHSPNKRKNNKNSERALFMSCSTDHSLPQNDQDALTYLETDQILRKDLMEYCTEDPSISDVLEALNLNDDDASIQNKIQEARQKSIEAIMQMQSKESDEFTYQNDCRPFPFLNSFGSKRKVQQLKIKTNPSDESVQLTWGSKSSSSETIANTSPDNQAGATEWTSHPHATLSQSWNDVPLSLTWDAEATFRSTNITYQANDGLFADEKIQEILSHKTGILCIDDSAKLAERNTLEGLEIYPVDKDKKEKPTSGRGRRYSAWIVKPLGNFERTGQAIPWKPAAHYPASSTSASGSQSTPVHVNTCASGVSDKSEENRSSGQGPGPDSGSEPYVLFHHRDAVLYKPIPIRAPGATSDDSLLTASPEEEAKDSGWFDHPKKVKNKTPISPASTATTTATTSISIDHDFPMTGHKDEGVESRANDRYSVAGHTSSRFGKNIESVRSSVQDARKKLEQLFSPESLVGPRFDMKDAEVSYSRPDKYLDEQDDMIRSSSSTSLFGTEYVPWPTNGSDEELTEGVETLAVTNKDALKCAINDTDIEVGPDNSYDNVLASPSKFTQSRHQARWNQEEQVSSTKSQKPVPISTSRLIEAVRVQTYWNEQIANRNGKVPNRTAIEPVNSKTEAKSDKEIWTKKPTEKTRTPELQNSCVRSKIQALEQHLTGVKFGDKVFYGDRIAA